MDIYEAYVNLEEYVGHMKALGDMLAASPSKETYEAIKIALDALEEKIQDQDPFYRETLMYRSMK